VGSRLRSHTVILKSGRGRHRKYLPFAFTEQGVAMLSSVLRSPRAVEVNIQIMRAFVRLRQLLSVHKELAERLTKLEEQMRRRDHAVAQQFQKGKGGHSLTPALCFLSLNISDPVFCPPVFCPLFSPGGPPKRRDYVSATLR